MLDSRLGAPLAHTKDEANYIRTRVKSKAILNTRSRRD